MQKRSYTNLELTNANQLAHWQIPISSLLVQVLKVCVTRRRVVGSLLYLSTRTRPDFVFAVGSVARFCANPSRRILRYLKGKVSLGLVYKGNGSTECTGFGLEILQTESQCQVICFFWEVLISVGRATNRQKRSMLPCLQQPKQWCGCNNALGAFKKLSFSKITILQYVWLKNQQIHGEWSNRAGLLPFR